MILLAILTVAFAGKKTENKTACPMRHRIDHPLTRAIISIMYRVHYSTCQWAMTTNRDQLRYKETELATWFQGGEGKNMRTTENVFDINNDLAVWTSVQAMKRRPLSTANKRQLRITLEIDSNDDYKNDNVNDSTCNSDIDYGTGYWLWTIPYDFWIVKNYK